MHQNYNSFETANAQINSIITHVAKQQWEKELVTKCLKPSVVSKLTAKCLTLSKMTQSRPQTVLLTLSVTEPPNPQPDLTNWRIKRKQRPRVNQYQNIECASPSRRKPRMTRGQSLEITSPLRSSVVGGKSSLLRSKTIKPVRQLSMSSDDSNHPVRLAEPHYAQDEQKLNSQCDLLRDILIKKQLVEKGKIKAKKDNEKETRQISITTNKTLQFKNELVNTSISTCVPNEFKSEQMQKKPSKVRNRTKVEQSIFDSYYLNQGVDLFAGDSNQGRPVTAGVEWRDLNKGQVSQTFCGGEYSELNRASRKNYLARPKCLLRESSADQTHLSVQQMTPKLKISRRRTRFTSSVSIEFHKKDEDLSQYVTNTLICGKQQFDSVKVAPPRSRLMTASQQSFVRPQSRVHIYRKL